jgi:hypothetical protein
MNWLKDIFSFLSAPVTTWIEKTEERKYLKEEGAILIAQAKVAFKVAQYQSKADRLKQNDATDAEYDRYAQMERRYTLADEFLILCTVVLVACHFFIPESMASGWAAMGYASPPWWLEFIIVGIFVSVFGLIRLFRAMNPFSKPKVTEAIQK